MRESNTAAAGDMDYTHLKFAEANRKQHGAWRSCDSGRNRQMTQGITQATSGIIQADSFDNLTAIVLASCAESSRRVYQHTYDSWQAYADDNGFHHLDFTFERIRDFVHDGDISHSARLQRLSHLKTLLRLMAIASPTARQLHQAMSFIRVDKQHGGNQRSKRALNFTELRKLLAVWTDNESDAGARNLALIHIAVYTGMRRAEIAELRWADIDLCACTLIVRNGKGGKERTVAIADATEGTCQVLREYKAKQSQGGFEYQYVFPRMTRGRSSTFADDKPIGGNTVWNAIKATADKAGIGHISPHDLRRTHITLALDSGATVADMQAQAGHAKAETTLLYAQAVDAKSRKKRIEF